MSNKLKTLSPSQLEHFITEKVSEYIGEECNCSISNMSTPNIDSEADIALQDERSINFEVKLWYKDDEYEDLVNEIEIGKTNAITGRGEHH